MKKQNKPRQTKSRRTVETSPRCFKRLKSKATWKTMHKCTKGKSYFKRKGCSHQMLINLVIDKENLFMTIFLTASSFCSIITQVPKTFNSTVALQGRWHRSAGFSLSQFVLFLHVIPDILNFKGVAHTNMTILSFTQPQAVPNLHKYL